MTDVIREAFEEWFEDKFDPDKELTLEDKDMCREAWQAALQSQTAPAVPEGWKLVPVEPTGEMQAAGAKAIRFNTTDINKLWTGNSVYNAMLAAAPQPDHSPDGGEAEACPRCKGTGQHVVGPVNFPRTTVCQLCKPAPTADAGKVGPVGWHGKPDQPGRYEVRGFDDDGTVGLVSVALDDGELVCNLHDRSTAEVSEYGYLLSDIDDGFEWRTLHPAQPRNEVPESELPRRDWAAIAKFVDEWAGDYEFETGGEGVYQPSEQERLLIEDAMHGLLDQKEFQRLIAPELFTPPVAPLVPENEVKARALEEFGRGLIDQYVLIADGAEKRHFTQAGEWALRDAARLRSNGGDVS